MEPFVHLPTLRVVVCKLCQFAIVTDEAVAHLRVQHPEIAASKRKDIAAAVQRVPSIIRSQTDLVGYTFPGRQSPPIPYIKPPETDGLKCIQCPYISRRPRKIQEHCRQAHEWTNEWQKGGDVRKKARVEREVPWTTGVHCQRLFVSRNASGWFEVMPPEAARTEAAAESQQMLDMYRQAEARLGAKRRVIAGDETKEPNLWLKRVGWAAHLQGLDPEQCRALVADVGEGEAVLQLMCDEFDRVMDRAKATAVPDAVGHAVLFEMNRKEVHIKAKRPFDSRMEEESWQRYKDVWSKILRFVVRAEELDDDKRPPYRLTSRQGEAFDAFDAFEEAAQSAAAGRPPP